MTTAFEEGQMLTENCNRCRSEAYQPKSEDTTMKLDSKSGAAIAAAAATLFLAGMTLSTVAQAADGHCIGANACKGHSACKGGKSPGPGANACKGQGLAMMSAAKCKAAKGKFEPA
jgi:hypothetical protein